MANSIGELVFKPSKVNLEWTFLYSNVEACIPGNYLRSPTFEFMNVACTILVFKHPNPAYQFYHLCLLVRDETMFKNIDFTLGFTINSRLLIRFGRKDIFMTQGLLITCSEIPDIRSYKRLTEAGEMLTVYCELSLLPETDVATQTTPDGTLQLCIDLRHLLESKEDPDMTIKVKGFPFPVHKVILGQRSDVFKAMFKHDMKEKEEGVVTINDFDPEIFYAFLLYIYSGDTKHISRDNMVALHALADKYCVDHLKEHCVTFMMKNIDLDTACDILVLADGHNHVQLKMQAETLILDNWKEIIHREEWRSVMAENNSLALEIIQKAAEKAA